MQQTKIDSRLFLRKKTEFSLACYIENMEITMRITLRQKHQALILP